MVFCFYLQKGDIWQRRALICLTPLFEASSLSIQLCYFNFDQNHMQELFNKLAQISVTRKHLDYLLIDDFKVNALLPFAIILLLMKILGIGIDLVMNARIQRIINKNYAERFIKKFLHQRELERYLQFENEDAQVQFVASRWAVKEALSKAIGRKELIFNEINIIKDKNGRPDIEIEGDQNENLFLQLQIARCHVSISHEKDYTIGTAIVEQYI